MVTDRGVYAMRDAVDMLQWVRSSENKWRVDNQGGSAGKGLDRRKAGDDPTTFNRQLRGSLDRVGMIE